QFVFVPHPAEPRIVDAREKGSRCIAVAARLQQLAPGINRDFRETEQRKACGRREAKRVALCREYLPWSCRECSGNPHKMRVSERAKRKALFGAAISLSY